MSRRKRYRAISMAASIEKCVYMEMSPAITCEFSLAHNSYGLPKWKCQPKILVRECLMGAWKTISQTLTCVFIIFVYVYTSVDTEMCCPKGVDVISY